MLHRSKPPFALAGLAAALALSACGQPDADAGPGMMGDPAAPVREPVPSVAPSAAPTAREISASPPAGYTDGSGVNEGYPDLAPAALTPAAERTETGARNVLISFARAIELREFDQAWAMLGRAAKAKWSKARFNSLFEGLSRITVAVLGGTMDGAAGSSYYTSEATITASDADGRPVRIEGPVVLRLVNDVPGSSAVQRRWHIEQLDLSPTS